MREARSSFQSSPPPAAPRFAAGDRVVDRVHLRDLPNYGEGVVRKAFTDARTRCHFYIVLFDDGELRAVTQACLDPAEPLGVYTCGVPQ